MPTAVPLSFIFNSHEKYAIKKNQALLRCLPPPTLLLLCIVHQSCISCFAVLLFPVPLPCCVLFACRESLSRGSRSTCLCSGCLRKTRWKSLSRHGGTRSTDTWVDAFLSSRGMCGDQFQFAGHQSAREAMDAARASGGARTRKSPSGEHRGDWSPCTRRHSAKQSLPRTTTGVMAPLSRAVSFAEVHFTMCSSHSTLSVCVGPETLLAATETNGCGRRGRHASGSLSRGNVRVLWCPSDPVRGPL